MGDFVLVPLAERFVDFDRLLGLAGINERVGASAGKVSCVAKLLYLGKCLSRLIIVAVGLKLLRLFVSLVPMGVLKPVRGILEVANLAKELLSRIILP